MVKLFAKDVDPQGMGSVSGHWLTVWVLSRVASAN